jgi:hypothetical protein
MDYTKIKDPYKVMKVKKLKHKLGTDYPMYIYLIDGPEEDMTLEKETIKYFKKLVPGV